MRDAGTLRYVSKQNERTISVGRSGIYSRSASRIGLALVSLYANRGWGGVRPIAGPF